MTFDRVVRGIVDATDPHAGERDVGILHDEIVAIEPRGTLDAPRVDEYENAFVLPGLVEIAETAPRADFLEAEFGTSLAKRGIVACGVFDHDGETVDLARLSAAIPQRIVRIASLPRADRFDELFSAAPPAALMAWVVGCGREDALAWPEVEAAVHVAARKDFLVIARSGGEHETDIPLVDRWMDLAIESGARIHLAGVRDSIVGDIVGEAREQGASVTASWNPWGAGLSDPRDSMDDLDIEDAFAMLECRAFEAWCSPRARGGSHDPFRELVAFSREFEFDVGSLAWVTSTRPSEILGFPVAPALALGRRPEFVVYDARSGTRLATYCGWKY